MNNRSYFLLILLAFLIMAIPGRAQKRDPQTIYSTNCMNCHGAHFEGGLGGSLVKGPWKHGNSAEELTNSIKNGYPTKEMPAWKGVLTDAEIDAMVAFLMDKIKNQASQPPTSRDTITGRTEEMAPNQAAAEAREKSVTHTELYNFRLETYVSDLKEPWSMAFLPDGGAIISERLGGLRLVDKDGKLNSEPIKNVPDHEAKAGAGEQSGLFDIKLHPDFATNHLIYLSFADHQVAPTGFNVDMTRIIRARLENNSLTDVKDIFVAPFKDYGTNGNFGGRMALDGKGYLFFSIGDRGQRQKADAQLLSIVNGKIHRVFDDGRVPDDNPFVKTPGAIGSIWAYGVRNPQGLCIDPTTGHLWEAEHGMKGGDEVNLIQKGLNYGWPLVTLGTDYGGKPPEGTLNGTHFASVAHLDGMEDPALNWTPSIAVCGINFYTGDLFPKWKGNLFAVSLASSQMHRIEIKDDKVVHDETILKGYGRLRFVSTGPDGALYILRPDRISRLVPAN